MEHNNNDQTMTDKNSSNLKRLKKIMNRQIKMLCLAVKLVTL